MKDNQGGHQGKIEDFLAELELKHLQNPSEASHLNPAFSARLDEFAKSIFEDPTLTKNFTTELRYGMGSALGVKLVEMLWDDLSPALGDSKPAEPNPELQLCLPEEHLARIEQNWNTTAVNFTKESGVLLPAIDFQAGEESALFLRALELGTFSEDLTVEEIHQDLLEILKKNAWRFLTFEQASDRLRALWAQKPKLFRATQEERIPLRTFVFVFRHLLRAGVPIVDLDLIVDSLLLNIGLDDLGIVADNVLAETEELICGKQEPEPRKRSAQELSIADEMSLELGKELAPYIKPDQPKNLVVTINKSRRMMAKNQGWVLPTVTLRVNESLGEREFRVLIRGVEVVKDEVVPGRIFVTGPLKELSGLEGQDYTDPVYGVAAKWADESHQSQADKAGLLTTDLVTFLSMMVLEAAFRNAHKLFTFEAFDEMLVAVKKSNFGIVRHFEEGSELRMVAKRVFYNLLKERVSIRDKMSILECVVNHRFETRNPVCLTELVRYELRESLCEEYLEDEAKLKVVRLDEEFEDYLLKSVTTTADSSYLTFGRKETERLLDLFELTDKELAELGQRAVFLTTPALRPILRYFLERRMSKVVILSESEIPDGVELVVLGELENPDPDQSRARMW
jgi:flagellar biosynthesis component FlhA